MLDDQQSYKDSDQYALREKLALLYTDAIMGNPLDADDELWAQLHEEFTEPELVAMGYYIGHRVGIQRCLITWHPKHGEYIAFLEERARKEAAAS